MKALAMDRNGDFIIKNGQFLMVEGQNQLHQEIWMSYGTAKGEWFLDEDAGMDYVAWQTKPVDETELRNDMIECLQGTSQEVSTNAIYIKQNLQTRKMQVDVELEVEENATFIMEDVLA